MGRDGEVMPHSSTLGAVRCSSTLRGALAAGAAALKLNFRFDHCFSVFSKLLFELLQSGGQSDTENVGVVTQR